MELKGMRRFVLGDKMPDKNDPAQKERIEKEVAAGEKFGNQIGLDKAGLKVTQFAINHSKAFFGIVIAIIVITFSVNVMRLVSCCSPSTSQRTAVEIQDSVISARRAINTAAQ